MKVTVWSWAQLPGIGHYAAGLLRALGYRVRLRELGDSYFAVAYNSRSKAQIGTIEWIADYPAASGFFQPLFSCAAFVPNSPLNFNASAFCDSGLDRTIEQALTEQATNPDAARGLWESVDKRTVDRAPWVPLVNPNTIDVVSKRVGNYQYSPNGLGVPFDQLWVR
jgi:peptide/nickel transport system substrate-binding protein